MAYTLFFFGGLLIGVAGTLFAAFVGNYLEAKEMADDIDNQLLELSKHNK